jgi:hypothetical protein
LRRCLWTSRKNLRLSDSTLILPTVTAIPLARSGVPASESRSGWGLSGSVLTMMGLRGALGRESSCGTDVKSRNVEAISSSSGISSLLTNTASRCPSRTFTLVQLASILTGESMNLPSSNLPRIFLPSLFIFSSSLEMWGSTLPRMSMDGTPG